MKKMKIFFTLVYLMILSSCSSLLDQEPQGIITSDNLNSPERIEQLIISAYSLLGENNAMLSRQMGCPYNEGSTRGGECYKGGSGTDDTPDVDLWEQFVYMQPIEPYSSLNALWYIRYCAINRIHDAMRRLKTMTDAEFPLRKQRLAELRFLRGHCYFYLKQCFKFFPYIDEDVPEIEYTGIGNDVYTDQELWNKIIEDFRFALQDLPEVQAEVGRPTKYAAKAYLAKTLLFAAYEQDEKHAVVNINREKLIEVAKLCKEVIDQSGKSLFDDFGKNFLCEYENGRESIWAIQFSANDDGSPVGRNNVWMIYPMNSEYGCCGFYQPSVNMMNTFKTFNGLPSIEDYNSGIRMDNKEAFNSTPSDPRLMHTAVVPGMPWKYDPGFVMQPSWARTPEVYGYAMSQKMIVLPTCPCFRKTNPVMGSGLNWDVLRMDEVMLWRAESLIQLGEAGGLQESLGIINQIRERAKNSTGMLKYSNGTPTGNFNVDIYKPGINCPSWTKNFAWEALKFERRLEFASEGKRFFDLVRWGEAAEFFDSYFAVEKTRRSYLKDARFTKGRDEYFPIPEQQISYSKGLYKQNTGW